MGKIILVTGGARSGKSSLAEEIAGRFGGNVLYIATSIPFDEEMKLRVQKHRQQRPSCWETLEAFRVPDMELEKKTAGKSAVMLDCITVMVTNIMFEMHIDWDSLNTEDMTVVEKNVRDQMEKLVEAAKKAEVPFILVTNEVGMGIVPENALSRLFRDIAGRMNQLLAKAADEVYFCVSGIPVKIK